MTPAEWGHLCTRRFDLRLRALTNRLYQQERQRRLELAEGLVKVVSLVAGSAALIRAADAGTVQLAVAAVFASTAASLVFGWGAKGRDAAMRAADWARMDHDIEAAGERTLTEAQLDAWAGRCSAIESTEPKASAVLLRRCHVRACLALGAPPPADGPAWWRTVLQVP